MDDTLRTILVVDDEIAVTNFLLVFLMQTGRYDATVLNDATEVPALLDQQTFDVILLDMDMPGLSGMDILRLLRERRIPSPVVILTGVNDVDLAVRAMKLGAFDYLIKPVEDSVLLASLDAAVTLGAVQESLRQLPAHLRREDLGNAMAFEQLVAVGQPMVQLLHHAERLAGSDLAVFLHGEPGTGRASLARSIHSASQRHQAPFTSLDLASHEPRELSAFLFGRVAGAEGDSERVGALSAAAGGTLYLENIDALPRLDQERLRLVLQSGAFYRDNSIDVHDCRVRFIVSSTVDLRGDAYQEAFSRDLLYHLAFNTLVLPPLRERPEDLPALAEHFLRLENDRQGKGILGFDDGALARLVQEPFPDNIRGLAAVIHAAVSSEQSGMISHETLEGALRGR
ncbi:MAG: sigma 54-interacting transcriptional regulator [Pseudomonadota bacterium]